MQRHYSITNLCMDLDGTVYRDGKLFAGIEHKLNEIHNQNTNLFYITNNTSKSQQAYISHLTSLGLPVRDDCLVTPIRVFNKSAVSDKKTYVLGCDEVADEVRNQVSNLANADQILVTFDKTLTYDSLAAVCGAINSGMPYYGTHCDLNCPSDSGPIPDCGGILKLIELTTSQSPVDNFGKPSVAYADFTMGCLAQGDTLVVGDRHSTDWEIGNLMKAISVLVETGDTIPEELYNKAIIYDSLLSVLDDYFG